jgi:nucleotidyltransferase/DNA polymerase involved in DNA repair
MYAQTEELRNPELAGRPLGVTQKYLIVTCNYPARAAGVTKLMATAEGLKKCPGLVLVGCRGRERGRPGRHAGNVRLHSAARYASLRRAAPMRRRGQQ